MSRLVLGFALALTLAGGASAEVVARGVQDGLLALGPKGTPSVAYVRGSRLLVATRAGKSDWRVARAGVVAAGSHVKAFTVGGGGPVALVQTGDDRRLFLVRREKGSWRATRIAGGLPAGVALGWPGLALDRQGLPVVAYTRWSSATWHSQLWLARLDGRGRVHAQRITLSGFPQSFVAPPAVPVLVRGRVHVVESYGYSGSVGTIEWYPQRRSWIGLFLSAGRGDFPVGPMIARVGPGGTVYAAWTESLLAAGDVPVILASHPRSSQSEIVADFVFDRALTTGLVLTPGGPEVAANEWVNAEDIGLLGSKETWAGAIVGHGARIELDGKIGGLAAGPQGARDLLLTGVGGLTWFRAPHRLTTSVDIDASAEADGGIHITGQVHGVSGGRVTLYRERPGAARQMAAKPRLVNGSFSFVDRPAGRPWLYRAVYRDPATGIPYAALLRQPAG